jgi:spore coat protein A
MNKKNKDDKTQTKNTKLSRRDFLKATGAIAGTAAIASILPSVSSAFNNQTSETFPNSAQAIKPPKKLTKYVDALVIPPALTPDTTTYPGFDYYTMSMVQGNTHKFHRDLQPTNTYSYFGTAPAAGFHYLGPTIVANRGTPVRIQFTNNLPLGRTHLLQNVIDTTIMGSTQPNGTPWTDENRVAVHLHGGKTTVPFDGGPRDWFSPVGSGQANPYPEGASIPIGTYTYDYPNDQAATLLWYHDHAWAITRFNPFLGLAGAYILRDNFENDLINGTNSAGQNVGLQTIPSGAYEVPIVLQDRLLDLLTGAMIYPAAIPPGNTHPIWIPEYFGDTPVVNGKAYPFLAVEPRRYRFRFLNGSQARFYSIWFNAAAGPSPMWVIGSEMGFLLAPAPVTRLVIAPGERFDVIFDFTGMANGTIITLKNNAKAPYPGGRGGDIPEIMQFIVGPVGTPDTTTPPAALTLPALNPAVLAQPPKPWREIVLSEMMDPVSGGPLEALLDGLNFTDTTPPNPPLFTETDGTINVWQFINTTGDAHPMHTHLVPFQIVNRQPIDTKAFLAAWDAWRLAGRPAATRPTVDNFLKGAAYIPAPEETGWKDTAKAYPGEVLRIITKFVLPAGVGSGTYRYVFHCHILEHEENDMMLYYAVNKP